MIFGIYSQMYEPIYKRLFGRLLITVLLMFYAASHAAQVSEITYYHPDRTGSPIAASDESGNMTWSQRYEPFGYRIDASSNEGAAVNNRIGFTGHYEDKNSGQQLVYMQGRYYDPVIGRFLGIDPAGVNTAIPETFNRYSYGYNNPLRYIDPDGNSSEPVDMDNDGDVDAEDELLHFVETNLASPTFIRPDGMHNPPMIANSRVKAPITGTAQSTKKVGRETTHASTSQRIAEEMAQNPEIKEVFLNRTITTVTERGVISRIRPDVAGLRFDGRVDAVEVLSRNQTQQQQNDKLNNVLGANAGTIRSIVADD